MGVKQLIARNVFWNWIGTATHLLAGFITFPILLNRLGVGDCGLWLLIISLTYYFDLLDFGLRGALGRNIAFFKAKNDSEGVSSVISTGLALLSGGAVLILIGTALVQLVFFNVFEVRPAAVVDVQTAIWIVGVNLALVFLFAVSEAVLWGYQRFDLNNFVNIPCIVLRTVLVVSFVMPGSQSLVRLSIIHVVITLATGVLTTFFACRIDRQLRLGLRYVRRDTVRKLFDFGIWCFLHFVGRILVLRSGQYIIGARFLPVMVPPFDAASRMVTYTKTIMLTGTGVLTPLITTWHAQNEHEKQRRLFVLGGKFCFALGLLFFGGLIFLGGSFLLLWTQRELMYAPLILTILITGELIPLSQWVTISMVLGKDRHRLWAIMSLIELGLFIGFALLFLALGYGIVGVALALAIPGTFCRGFVHMVYGCQLVQVPLTSYVYRAMLPPLLAAALPIGLLGLATFWHEPVTWLEFLGYGTVYVVLFAILTVFVIIGFKPSMTLLNQLIEKWRRRKAVLQIEKEAASDAVVVETGTRF